MRCFQRFFWNTFILLLWALACLYAAAQEPKPTAPIAPSSRLAAAKNAFLTGSTPSAIPYDVIESSLEGWGRYTLVDSPAQADVVMEISSWPPPSSSSPATSGRRATIGPAPPNPIFQLKLSVYDARSKVQLWSATESLRSAWHKKTYEDSLVDASAQLVARLRKQVEPAPASGDSPGDK